MISPLVALILSVTAIAFWSPNFAMPRRERTLPQWLQPPKPEILPSKRKGIRRIARTDKDLAARLDAETADQPHCPLYGWHAKNEEQGTNDGCYALRENRCIRSWTPPTPDDAASCEVYQLTRRTLAEYRTYRQEREKEE